MCRRLKTYSYLENSEKRIIVWNLGGLTSKHITSFIANCPYAEFRTFNFSKYPDYVRNLFEYRWKALIIAEALLEFRIVWWIDTSTLFFDERGSLQVELIFSNKKQLNLKNYKSLIYLKQIKFV